MTDEVQNKLNQFMNTNQESFDEAKNTTQVKLKESIVLNGNIFIPKNSKIVIKESSK